MYIKVSTLTETERALVMRAMHIGNIESVTELRTVFSKGLGMTLRGSKILNARDFSMRDIAAVRDILALNT